jgi:hypothetical protein
LGAAVEIGSALEVLGKFGFNVISLAHGC